MKEFFDRDTVQKALKLSRSCSDALLHLGIPVNKNNTRRIYYYIRKWGLDTTSLSKNRFEQGHSAYNVMALEKILVENSPYKGSNTPLKKRLIRAGIFEYKCYSCNRKEWLGEEIPLQLEHKNGDNMDLTIVNLTLLCPNCHALTPTFCGRNIRTYREKSLNKKRA